MIGQTTLQNKLYSFSYSALPQSIMIEGEFGCGKHLLVNEMSEHYGVDVEDLTKKLKYEYLSSLFSRSIPYIYFVTGDSLQPKEQNSLLKFLEEPPNVAKVIVLCENKNNLLETIQNRCSIFSFGQYSEEELLNFTADKLVLKYAKTPGQVIELEKNNLTSVEKLCITIIENIGIASIPNTLSLTKKFKFGEEEGYNIDLFSNILIEKVKDKFIECNDKKYSDAYFIVSKFCNDLKFPTVNKKKLFESFLINLKKTLR